MPVLSINEAKLLADALQHSFLEAAHPAPKRGHWLNYLAKADGYRDWNVMSAQAPAHPPDMTFLGGWKSVFYTLALVELPGQPAAFHMLRTPDRNEAHPRNGWPGQLAEQVRRQTGIVFRGCQFDYRRPDPLFENEQRTHTHLRPIVMSMRGGAVRILVWWLEHSYTAGQNLSTPFIPINRLTFVASGYGAEPPADQFLHRLTLLPQLRRTCLYVPQMPNVDERLYCPVIVTEDEAAGVVAPGWEPGDKATLREHVDVVNAASGLSRLDVSMIAHRYSCFERPAPEEEDYFDVFGMFED